MISQTLACVAPSGLLANVCAVARAHGRNVVTVVRSSQRTGSDPFSVGCITRDLAEAADAVLLVAPKRMGARRASPASVVNGMPIGLLFADSHMDLTRWVEALARQNHGASVWAVLAMRTQDYLSRARQLCCELRKSCAYGLPPVRSWLSDEVTPWDLADRLAIGPRLVIYLGHATPSSLSGYLGLEWDSVAVKPMVAPCGTVVCLACNTLHGGGASSPIGRMWVHEGRAGAFWGAVGPTSTVGNALLTSLLSRILRGGKVGGRVPATSTGLPRTIGEVLTELAEVVVESGEPAVSTFARYRLVGDPLQSI